MAHIMLKLHHNNHHPKTKKT